MPLNAAPKAHDYNGDVMISKPVTTIGKYVNTFTMMWP